MKQLDLSKTLYELTEEYPELIAILADIGFLGIKNPTSSALSIFPVDKKLKHLL